jgi:hypothetical protein
MIEGIIFLLALCGLFLALRPADKEHGGCHSCSHAENPDSCKAACPKAGE